MLTQLMSCLLYTSGVPNDGNGGAGHSLRSDMNWDSMDTDVLEHWQKVGVFRNNHISVGAGSNTSLTSTSGYAFARDYEMCIRDSRMSRHTVMW